MRHRELTKFISGGRTEHQMRVWRAVESASTRVAGGIAIGL